MLKRKAHEMSGSVETAANLLKRFRKDKKRDIGLSLAKMEEGNPGSTKGFAENLAAFDKARAELADEENEGGAKGSEFCVKDARQQEWDKIMENIERVAGKDEYIIHLEFPDMSTLSTLSNDIGQLRVMHENIVRTENSSRTLSLIAAYYRGLMYFTRGETKKEDWAQQVASEFGVHHKVVLLYTAWAVLVTVAPNLLFSGSSIVYFNKYRKFVVKKLDDEQILKVLNNVPVSIKVSVNGRSIPIDLGLTDSHSALSVKRAQDVFGKLKIPSIIHMGAFPNTYSNPLSWRGQASLTDLEYSAHVARVCEMMRQADESDDDVEAGAEAVDDDSYYSDDDSHCDDDDAEDDDAEDDDDDNDDDAPATDAMRALTTSVPALKTRTRQAKKAIAEPAPAIEAAAETVEDRTEYFLDAMRTTAIAEAAPAADAIGEAVATPADELRALGAPVSTPTKPHKSRTKKRQSAQVANTEIDQASGSSTREIAQQLDAVHVGPASAMDEQIAELNRLTNDE